MARKAARDPGAGGAGVPGIRRARTDRDFHHAVLSSDSAAAVRLEHRRRLASRVSAAEPVSLSAGCAASAQTRARVHRARVRPRARSGCGRRKARCRTKRCRIAAEAGFEWAASDNGVLARTLHKTAGAGSDLPPVSVAARRTRDADDFPRSFPERLSRVRLLQDGRGGSGRAISGAHPRQRAAAAGAMARTCWCPSSWMAKTPGNTTIRTAGRSCANCTRASADSSDLDALTVSEALKLDQPRPLDHIFPGSWINANFDVWIGAEEDNKAWEYLLRARQKFDEAAAGVPEESRRAGV